jgi:hypothetical protein
MHGPYGMTRPGVTKERSENERLKIAKSEGAKKKSPERTRIEERRKRKRKRRRGEANKVDVVVMVVER